MLLLFVVAMMTTMMMMMMMIVSIAMPSRFVVRVCVHIFTWITMDLFPQRSRALGLVE